MLQRIELEQAGLMQLSEQIDEEAIDWSLTTFEGAQRKQIRRWSHLPLERIILALEEMQELAEKFGGSAREER